MLTETSNRKLRIVLSGLEMQELFGGYRQIDYRDPRTKETIHDLFKRAFPHTDFLNNTAKIHIEVRPYHGGCSIDFIKGERPYKRLYAPTEGILYFQDGESLIEAVLTLKDPETIRESTLYGGEHGYFLKIKTSHRQFKEWQQTFTVNRNPVYQAAIAEYKTVLCQGNAVQKLKTAFSQGAKERISFTRPPKSSAEKM